MKSALIFVLFFSSLSGVLAQPANIVISNEGAPNETCIAIDTARPERVMVGANIDNYYISSDTGKTWTSNKLTSKYGVWGDPVIAVDRKGHWYFFHLSNPPEGNWIDRIVCQKSTDFGKTWTEGTYTGLNGARAQDKHWVAIDPERNFIYVTWTQFDKYDSKNATDSTLILFSKSVDGGEKWSYPVRINETAGNCVDSDSTVEGAVPAIGPDGEIYVAWAGPDGLVFDKSMDRGKTWLKRDIRIDSMPTGWDYKIPGLGRCNGLPVTVCDVSKGSYRGNIYVNWSDQRNGEDDTDVWLARSEDGGDTWSGPIRVNDDMGKSHQFMSWMCVDHANGDLYVLYYDRRNLSNDSTNVYLARSDDGGRTFTNLLISESPFQPKSWSFFGDYLNVVAYKGNVFPVWTRSDRGKLSILTARVKSKDFKK